MSKQSYDKGRIDADRDSNRDSTERSSNSIIETAVGSRHNSPPSNGSAQDRRDYQQGWRDEKNSR